MQNTVNKFLKEAFINFKDDGEEFKRHEWVMNPSHTAQAVSVIGSIKWCDMTQNILGDKEDQEDQMVWWMTENIN
jgi:hypothetical protein